MNYPPLTPEQEVFNQKCQELAKEAKGLGIVCTILWLQTDGGRLAQGARFQHENNHAAYARLMVQVAATMMGLIEDPNNEVPLQNVGTADLDVPPGKN